MIMSIQNLPCMLRLLVIMICKSPDRTGVGTQLVIPACRDPGNRVCEEEGCRAEGCLRSRSGKRGRPQAEEPGCPAQVPAATEGEHNGKPRSSLGTAKPASHR